MAYTRSKRKTIIRTLYLYKSSASATLLGMHFYSYADPYIHVGTILFLIHEGNEMGVVLLRNSRSSDDVWGRLTAKVFQVPASTS